MESTDDVASASGQLAEYAKIQGSVQRLNPPRGYWQLQLWSAVLFSAFYGAYLYMHGGRTPAEVGAGSGGYSATWALMAPVLLFGSLVGGARERFSVQTKPSRLQRLGFVMLMLAFVALMALSFADVDYPSWLNAALPVALFAMIGLQPLRKLLATPRDPAEVWGNVPLPTEVRIMTACTGLTIGILLACASVPFAAAVSGFTIMLCLGVALLARHSRFGLERVGFEWGSLHWSAFGVSAAIAFLSATLGTVTTWFSTPHSVGAGALVFFLMSVVAALPRNRASREA